MICVQSPAVHPSSNQAKDVAAPGDNRIVFITGKARNADAEPVAKFCPCGLVFQPSPQEKRAFVARPKPPRFSILITSITPSFPLGGGWEFKGFSAQSARRGRQLAIRLPQGIR
jgi:hypothetical protein